MRVVLLLAMILATLLFAGVVRALWLLLMGINAVDVALLKLERGDVLAILTDEKLSHEQANRIGQSVQRAVNHIPGVRVLVFDVGLKPTIVRGDGSTDTPPKESRLEGVTGSDSPGPPVGSCSGEGIPV